MEDHRYPISIRLIGVMHKEKSKMYMISVLWSDQNDIIIYRSLQDFKNMHKSLKKAFPQTNPLKKTSRIIPQFRDKNARKSPKKKSPSRSVGRLQFLEKYCNDLLSCDPRVTHSAELRQFFSPNNQDLEPDFSKNSIMVMPSDDDGGHDKIITGNVTQPFVTETYQCVAPYETKCTKNRPFKVALDEKVDVLIKDKAGWWLVESEDKRLAWFPAPYLEKVDYDEDDEEDDMDGSPGTDVLYTAMKTYKAAKEDEISVDIGSVVEVLQKPDNGWWLIRYNHKVGYIPSMYLKLNNNPRARMATVQQDLRKSSQNLSQLQGSPRLEHQSHQFSHSQSNLLPPPGLITPRSPQLKPADKLKSRSMNMLTEPRPAQLVASPIHPGTISRANSTSATTNRAPAPTIMVQMDGEEDSFGSSLTLESDESFGSSDFSDDVSITSESSSLNLSYGHMDERLRLSRTPPPMSANHLSPTSSMGGRMLPSISDPNLYKRPVSPKVPPRPPPQMILTRCTTITRKNASKAGLPAQGEILSR